MPSICGIFHRQPKAVDPKTLALASEMVPSCGASSTTFITGSVGCTGTLSHQHSSLIVADIRLDNRTELAGLLFLSPPYPSDAELLLAAYLKWGSRSPEYLLGDFAFAIWDESKQHFFCARDPFGVRPFYYSLQDHVFVFASAIKAALCFAEVSDQFNEERISDYLSMVVADHHSTFYTSLRRLPPGTSLTVSPDSHIVQEYYSFQPVPLRYRNNQDYADHFKEIFKEAVACRIHQGNNGFLLSGGLDSSSIVCMAEQDYRQSGQEPLEVYSGIFDTVTQCDERTYINAVLAKGQFNWHTVKADELDLFGVLPEMARCQDEPWFAPHMFMIWGLLSQMHDHGRQVVLDGHDGDTTVSHGWSYINNLIQDSRFITLFGQAQDISRVHGRRCYKDLLRKVYQQKIRGPLAKNPPLAALYHALRGQKKLDPLSPDADLALLNPEFRRSSHADERFLDGVGRFGQTNLREEAHHLQSVFEPIQPFALEVLVRSARHFGMEYHCPFWDKRLVEFCLQLPPEQKLQDGLSRSVLRRAMVGVLPDQIQQRPGKIDFTPNLSHSFAKENGHQIKEIVGQALPVVEKWVDKELVSNYYWNQSVQSTSNIMSVWKVVTLAAWVQSRGI